MSAPIFISYSSKDQAIAETLCRALEGRGHDCWIACRDVHPGENFQEAIVRALRTAKVMLLVFTSNANNSEEIKKELVLAGRHHVTVMPVRVEDVVPNDAFTYEFATRQWADLFKDWEREVELLATRIGHVLQNPALSAGGGAETAMPPPRRVGPRRSRRPLFWGAALLAAVLVIGGVVFYMRPSAIAPRAATPPATAAPPQQTAAQAPAPAPAAQPPAATAPPPEPTPSPKLSAEEMAWRNAAAAGTRAALADYQKAFPAGAHAREAELQIDDLIIAGPNVKSSTFDGTWAVTWTCPAVGPTLAYTYQFSAHVKDGDIHGQNGSVGEPGALSLDGKIEPDGTAAMFGTGIVGNSAAALGNTPVGRQFYFHVTAHFDRGSGTGHRIESRVCDVSFVKQ